MKKLLNYITVHPTGTEVTRAGRIISINEGRHTTLFIGHRPGEEHDEEGNPVQVTEAFPIRVEKPVTRDKAINAAEMQAYRLVTPLEVASFGTALGRKHRENPNHPEVREHDEFINWVRQELTKIGI